jgi:phosphoglycerol geranylgeranyltransferase
VEILQNIKESLQVGKLHMTLIDPEKQPTEVAGEVAGRLEGMGTDAIMVGGSTGVTRESLDSTVKCIKSAVEIPVILFPADARAVSQYADAIYFMSMLNSRSTRMLIGEQVRASKTIKDMGLETISMGYVVVEPGMKVGEVGLADPLPRDDPELAARYGLAAELLGMDLFYLEAGSGAPSPVPTRIVKAVKEEISIPLVVGGGIRDSKSARELMRAGADILVTGTAVEQIPDIRELEGILDAVKRGNR